jgi:uncharacterized protein
MTTMSPSSKPSFSILSFDVSENLLQRARIGRLAFVAQKRVDIEPVHFVYHDRWIYLRTSPGTKLASLLHHPWVALQVDEVSGDFDWQSAVAKGTVYFIEDDTPHGAELRALVIALFQRILPASFTDSDPTPERDVLLRFYVDEIQGREASTVR